MIFSEMLSLFFKNCHRRGTNPTQTNIISIFYKYWIFNWIFWGKLKGKSYHTSSLQLFLQLPIQYLKFNFYLYRTVENGKIEKKPESIKYKYTFFSFWGKPFFIYPFFLLFLVGFNFQWEIIWKYWFPDTFQDFRRLRTFCLHSPKNTKVYSSLFLTWMFSMFLCLLS